MILASKGGGVKIKTTTKKCCYKCKKCVLINYNFLNGFLLIYKSNQLPLNYVVVRSRSMKAFAVIIILIGVSVVITDACHVICTGHWDCGISYGFCENGCCTVRLCFCFKILKPWNKIRKCSNFYIPNL